MLAEQMYCYGRVAKDILPKYTVIGRTYCFQAHLFGIILIRRALPTTFCNDRDYEKVSGRIKQQFHETATTYFGTLSQ